MKFEYVQSKFSEKFQSQQFPFDIIVVIINIIISLIKGCSKEEVLSQANKQTFLTRLLVRRKVREILQDEYGKKAFHTHNGEEIVKNILEVSKEAPETEIINFYNEASNLE